MSASAVGAAAPSRIGPQQRSSGRPLPQGHVTASECIIAGMGIILKNTLELQRMRAAGRIVSHVLETLEAACVPGVTTAQLNRIAERELARAGARSAFLGYRAGGITPYPAVLCTSV